MKHFIWLLLLVGSIALANYDAKPLPVLKGGLGDASLNAYGVMVGGTTTTSPVQSLSSVGTSGQVLTSQGASALPQWSSPIVYANQALSNLSGVAINSSLLPASAGSADVGSAALPFGTDFAQNLELIGSVSGHFILAGATTISSWTAVVPPAVCSNGQYWSDNGSGVYSCTSPSSVNPTIANGGNTSYSIPGVNYHVRAATALTADQTYTLPVCSGGNVAGRVEVKNLPSNSHNIIVAGNGGDLVDGSANYTVYPGDSLPVICAVTGSWDVE